MYSLRVTAPDGTTRTHPFPGTQVTIGRDASNTIVLEGNGVSAFHCMIEVQAGGICTLKERGSTNGTWLNGRKLEEPTRIGDDDTFYVGTYLVQVTRMAPMPEHRGTGPLPEIGVSGPILRGPAPHRAWRDMHTKLLRWAEEWDIAERPAKLLLRSEEVPKAVRWLATPPPSVTDDVPSLVREYIAQSRAAASRRTTLGLVGAGVGLVALAGLTTTLVLVWPKGSDEPVASRGTDTSAEDTGALEDDDDDDDRPTPPPTSDDDDAVVENTEGPIEHTIIPIETIDDIAKRYGVAVDDIVEWNLINPDAKLEPGTTLKIEKPVKRPLPQVKVDVTIEAGDTWRDLATRFGVDVTRLRAYNPGVEALAPAAKITVWVDPKPYKPREPRQPIPEFHIDKSARSIGNPNNGRLDNGIKLPESDAYTVVSPHVYGSAYAMASMQKALATFRQDVDYDGLIIVSDMSKKGGGHLDPHKSHQAGRDVDIWLPSVRGVYRKKDKGVGLKKMHRPVGNEIDWYATFGLVRALIQTGAVKEVYLDWSRQKYVYDAARNMGATPQQLDEWIQYPRKQTSGKGVFRHSAEHYTHIHVRFKCADWEKPECQDTNAPPGG